MNQTHKNQIKRTFIGFSSALLEHLPFVAKPDVLRINYEIT